MEKLKDFIYEHSDLFFTTVIVIVVGVVVSSSLYGWFNIKDDENKYKEMNEVIQEEQLPNQDSSAEDKPDTSKNNNEPANQDTGNKTDVPSNDAKVEKPVSQNEQSNNNPAQTIKNIEIASGSSSASIAASLEKQGLVKSASEFLNLLVSSGKETKLKAGTFAITQGSTDSQIIDILTK